jgi:hypothetical protein
VQQRLYRARRAGHHADLVPHARESKTIAVGAVPAGAGVEDLSSPATTAAATTREFQYWAALETQAQRQSSLGTGTYGPSAQAPLCEVYYFHTDQAGLPEELSNAQGQLVWQAQYRTWGSTVEERWESRRLHGAKVQGQTQGDIPGENRQEQNLRCSTRNNVVSRVKNIIQRRYILKFRRYQMTG